MVDMIRNLGLWLNGTGVGLFGKKYNVVPPLTINGRVKPVKLIRSNAVNNGHYVLKQTPAQLARGTVRQKSR